MAGLTDTTIAASYDQLLIVDRDGGGNSTTHVTVKDGDGGTTFPITLATDSIMITSTNRLEFGDDASYIHQSADGVLDLVSDTEIEINATTIDINGALDVSGNITMADDTSIGISDSDERIEFDASGDISVLGANLGVGTTAADGLLHVFVSDVGVTASADADELILENNASSADSGMSILTKNTRSGVIFFGDGDSATVGRIQYNHANDYMRFDAAGSERMRLDSSGNVGIGTDSPASTLEVAGKLTVDDSNAYIDLKRSGTTISTIGADATGEFIVYDTSASAYRMVIDSSGNINFSDVFKFYRDTTPELHIVDSDDSNYALIGYSDGTLDISSNHGNEGGGADVITFKTGGSEQVRINNTGVGIGTTAPDQVLHCKVSSGDPSIVCETASGGGARLKLIGTDTNMSIQSSGGLLFYTGASTTANGTDRMRFTSDGKLGIGNGLNPSLMFQVQAADGESDNAAVARFQNLESTNNRSKGIHISAGSTVDDWAIHVDDHDSSNTLMRLCGNGYLALGHASPTHMLHVAGASQTRIAKFFNDDNNASYGGINVQCGADDQSGTTVYFEADDGDGQGAGVIENASGTFQLRDTSDIRLKKNVVDTAINGLDKVNAMKVRDFTWKRNDIDCSAGFIANELVEVFAPAVGGNGADAMRTLEDGREVIDPMTVSRERLVPVLVKAIQELSAKVTALENA